MDDVVVVGGGMAGLTAAARAASEVGASPLSSAPTNSVARPATPAICGLRRQTRCSPRSTRTETRHSVKSWSRDSPMPSSGSTLSECPVGDEVVILRYGRGRHIDTAAYVRACQKLIASSGGEIICGASVDKLIGDRAVAAVDLRMPDGTGRRLEASWTVLATGGYQADRDLTAELIHPNAPLMPLRSNPVSTGAGLRLATGWGPASGPRDAGFYGHLVLALIFNRRGARFIDRDARRPSDGHGRGRAAAGSSARRGRSARARRVGARCLRRGHRSHRPVRALCRRRGGRYALATSLDDFAYLPPDWGYPGEVVRAAIERFNESARAGRPLEPGRRFDPLPLDRPPLLRRRGGCRHHLHVRRCAHRRPRTRARRSSAADPGVARGRRRRRRLVRARLRGAVSPPPR